MWATQLVSRSRRIDIICLHPTVDLVDHHPDALFSTTLIYHAYTSISNNGMALQEDDNPILYAYADLAGLAGQNRYQKALGALSL